MTHIVRPVLPAALKVATTQQKPTFIVVGPTGRELRELAGVSLKVGAVIEPFGTLARDSADVDASLLINQAVDAFGSRKDVVGVIGTDDVGSVIAASVAERLGLPGPASAALLSAQHKLTSRIAQQAALSPENMPEFRAVSLDATEAPLPFPFFLKPVRGHLSMLATRIDNIDQFRAALAEARAKLPATTKAFADVQSSAGLTGGVEVQSMIAESIITGDQVTVDGFVSRGEVQTLGVVDSVMYPGTKSFKQFDYPSRTPVAVQQRMQDLAAQVARSAGLDETMFNVEMSYDPGTDKLQVIELNTRMSSQFASLYEAVDGTNPYELQLALASGQKPSFERKKGQFPFASSFALRTFEDHRVAAVPRAEDIERLTGQSPDLRVEVLVKEGQRLSESPQDTESFRYGIINLGGHSREQLAARRDEVIKQLDLKLEPLSSAERFEVAVAGAGDWIGQPGMTSQIPAGRIDGMHRIYTSGRVASGEHGYLTQYFLDQVGLQGANVTPDVVHTYAYFPEGHPGTESHKGGGRDHLMAGPDGAASSHGKKGSGTNPRYSAINGTFDLSNFRRNGLLELQETLVEQAIGRRINELRGPVVPHDQLAVLPAWVQQAIAEAVPKGADSHWTNHLAVQVDRDLRIPRESMLPASSEQAARLVGFQTLFNIGHGAMAPANVAAGHFLDLGHMSFNPPVTSGLYRCATCVGNEGSTANAPDWFLSSLGHYYPGADRNSYTFNVDAKQAGSIVLEAMKLLNSTAAPVEVSASELVALQKAWKEELPFMPNIEYEQHLLGFGERLLGAKLPGDFKPHKLSVGLRFIMQVAGLRQTLPSAEADAAKQMLLRMSVDRAAVGELYALFERALQSARPTAEMLKPLYDQDLPTNLMIERLKTSLGNVEFLDMESVQRHARSFLETETKPVEISPERFYEEMVNTFRVGK